MLTARVREKVLDSGLGLRHRARARFGIRIET